MPSIDRPRQQPAKASNALRLTSLAATSAIFIVAYALANLWTAQRNDIGQGVFDFERAIPFIPWTIVPYLSVMAFFAASFFVGDRDQLARHVRCISLALSSLAGVQQLSSWCSRILPRPVQLAHMRLAVSA